jgi:chromosome segregation ATPase
MGKALEATRTETAKLKDESKTNRARAKDAAAELAKLDAYDAANYKTVAKLKSEIKDLDSDNKKLETNIGKLENITKSFS